MSERILYDLEFDEDKTLLEAAANDLVDKNCKIILKPLGRFGKTSAKLFIIRGKSGDGVLTAPYIAKLDTASNIRREKRNTKSVASFFALSTPVKFSRTLEDRGILLLTDQGDEELKSALDRCVGAPPTASLDGDAFERVLNIVTIVFSKLPEPGKSRRTVKVREGFKQYLRKRIGIRNMKRYAHRGNIIPGADGSQWGALLDRIKEFLNSDIDVTVGVVHGDLHPSNIIVDRTHNDKASLIDFAWASRDGVAAIDYAMMENSIHYMWAPFWLPERFWKIIDNYMLKNLEVEAREKEACLRALGGDRCLKAWANAVWDVMVTIRTAARTKGLSREELLATRAALLLGQAKFSDYAPPRIGAQLWRLLKAMSV